MSALTGDPVPRKIGTSGLISGAYELSMKKRSEFPIQTSGTENPNHVMESIYPPPNAAAGQRGVIHPLFGFAEVLLHCCP
jgi:hypothetical protein